MSSVLSGAKGDTDFMGVIQTLYGLHKVKFITLFENTCWAVLTQRTLMSASQVRMLRIASASKIFSDTAMAFHVPTQA